MLLLLSFPSWLVSAATKEYAHSYSIMHRRLTTAGIEVAPHYHQLLVLSLIHISEPTRLGMISYAVFCLKKKKERGRIATSRWGVLIQQREFFLPERPLAEAYKKFRIICERIRLGATLLRALNSRISTSIPGINEAKHTGTIRAYLISTKTSM